jgi:hypothetical protein
MRETLKECPFCGGYPDTLEEGGREESHPYFTHCRSCYVETPRFQTLDGAENFWNQRFIVAQQIKELDQLREEKKTWQKVCKWEKEKYIKWGKALPYHVSTKELEHVKNLEKLAGDK